MQKEFSADPTAYDCKKFIDSRAEEDCVTFKEDYGNNNTPDCAKLKSNLFINYCQFIYVNKNIRK